jgi:hypothetical protein
MVSRFVWKVVKPNPLRVRVRYWAMGIIGSWKVRPRMYSGLEETGQPSPSNAGPGH